ncbi:MAG: hypothetical protein HY537_00480 [Deltaproteobacteria bacterium]|nr:hypothetical protein [Deltaproteobacteria bacterium]
MHSRRISWSIFAALLLPSLCFAQATTAQLLLEHDINFSESHDVPTDPLLIVSIAQGKMENPINRVLIERLAQVVLTQNHVSADTYNGEFKPDFLYGKLKVNDLLRPKLVIDIRNELQEFSGYTINCSITYLVNQEQTPGSFKARNLWSREQTFKGISAKDVENNIARYIEKQLKDFSRQFKQLNKQKSGASHRSQPAGDGRAVGYKLYWRDPSNQKSHIEAGATTGTPTPGNLSAGFWGGQSFPLVLTIAGMYYRDDNRGVALDVGYAFVNKGALKHALGATVALLDQTITTATPDTNVVLGYDGGTHIQIRDVLVPYVGPSYTAKWYGFRASVGAGWKLGAEQAPNTRLLFQLGYCFQLFDL